MASSTSGNVPASRLGRSGLHVSRLGLGTYGFAGLDEPTAQRILDQAYDAGLTLIDTADTYGGGRPESMIGAWLRAKRRESVVVSTKGGNPTGPGPNQRGASRLHLTEALHASLKRLRTDYVDLYQVHVHDPETEPEETLRALDDMVRAGKVRYVGASRYPASELSRSLRVAGKLGSVRFESVQLSYSLIDRSEEREMFQLCLSEGVGLITYWPLGGGILTGKYSREGDHPAGSRVFTQPEFADRMTPARLEAAAAVKAEAAGLGCTAAQLALAWVLRQPQLACTLVGATSATQLADNLGALSLTAPPATWARLDALSDGFKRVGLRHTQDSP